MKNACLKVFQTGIVLCRYIGNIRLSVLLLCQFLRVGNQLLLLGFGTA